MTIRRTGTGQTSESPCDLPATELARRLQRRELSARDAVEAHLSRIAERNGALNAVVSLDPARARAQADAADAALRRGDAVGPLHGVPMTLKDAHDVAGLRTTVGSPLFDRLATEDGAVAARLRAAGAIITAHTNVPAFLGDFAQSVNPIFGRTANPWDTERVPGGSSGGAAAALAAGMTPLEVGSDLAGSIRLPAHFCGVYGLKTTEHRVPLTGFFRQPPGVPRSVRILNSLGPMARTLDDLELALSIIAGPDGLDTDAPPVPLVRGDRRPLETLRLAVVPALPSTVVSHAIRDRIEHIAMAAARAGAHVETRAPGLDWAALHPLFADLVATITGVFDPGSDPSDERHRLRWYFGALERRDGFISAAEQFFGDVDALVLPTGMTSAFTHREPGTPVVVDGATIDYWQLPALATPWNLTGSPALSVPAGLDDDGMPIGVQIVGPAWSEMRLLDIARELERTGVLPGFQPPPAP